MRKTLKKIVSSFLSVIIGLQSLGSVVFAKTAGLTTPAEDFLTVSLITSLIPGNTVPNTLPNGWASVQIDTKQNNQYLLKVALDNDLVLFVKVDAVDNEGGAQVAYFVADGKTIVPITPTDIPTSSAANFLQNAVVPGYRELPVFFNGATPYERNGQGTSYADFYKSNVIRTDEPYPSDFMNPHTVTPGAPGMPDTVTPGTSDAAPGIQANNAVYVPNLIFRGPGGVYTQLQYGIGTSKLNINFRSAANAFYIEFDRVEDDIYDFITYRTTSGSGNAGFFVTTNPASPNYPTAGSSANYDYKPALAMMNMFASMATLTNNKDVSTKVMFRGVKLIESQTFAKNYNESFQLPAGLPDGGEKVGFRDKTLDLTKNPYTGVDPNSPYPPAPSTDPQSDYPNGPNDVTAEAPNGIQMKFSVPRRYTLNNGFEPAAGLPQNDVNTEEPALGLSNMGFEIELISTNYNLKVFVNNTTGGGQSNPTNGSQADPVFVSLTPADPSFPTPSADYDATTGLLTLEELPHTVLFQTATTNTFPIGTSDVSPISGKASNPDYQVYTFVQFNNKSPRDSQNIVSFAPYPGEEGTYALFKEVRGGNGPPPSTIKDESPGVPPNIISFQFVGVNNSNDPDYRVELPMDLSANDPSTYYYRVVFFPGERRPLDANRLPDIRVRSQWARLESLAEYSEITAPDNLIVDEDKTYTALLPKGDTLREIQGDLHLTLHWNVGLLTEITKFLKSAPGNTTTIYYDLQHVLSPLYASSPYDTYRFDRLKLTLTYNELTYKITAEYDGIDIVEYQHPTFIVSKVDTDLANNGYAVDGTPPEVMLRTDVDLIIRVGDIAKYSKGTYNHEIYDGNWLEMFYSGLYYLTVTKLTPDPDRWPPKTPITPPLPNPALKDDYVDGSKSNYASLTVSRPEKAQIPTGQNLTAYDAVTKTAPEFDTYDEVSFRAKWEIPRAQLKKYLDDNYESYRNVQLTYNLYIAQTQNKIEMLGSRDSAGQRTLPAGVNVVTRQFSQVLKPYPQTNNTKSSLYFSDITGENGNIWTDKPELREALRKGDIVCIENIPATEFARYLANPADSSLTFVLDYKLDGLDKNQRYFISVESLLKFTAGFTDTNGKIQWEMEIKDEYSKLSNIAAITTAGDRTSPKPTELVPGTPYPLVNTEVLSATTGGIYWDKATPVYDGKGKMLPPLEYEIVRLKETQMSETLRTARLFDIYDVLRDISQDPQNIETLALKTNAASDLLRPFILQYDPASASWLNPASEQLYAGSKQTDKQIFVTDNTVLPNTVYFYYVRTILRTDITDSSGTIIGQKEVYSPWVGVAVTTKVVSNPTNLVVLRKDVLYDPIHEFWIEFDVPAADKNGVGNAFDLQYSIRANDNDWQNPVTMNPNILLSHNPVEFTDDNGNRWVRYRYKISNLNAGTSYMVHVRMIDRKTKDASMWSNTAQTRTDTDQEEYDKDKEITDWLEYLKNELSVLFKDPMWYAQDDSNIMTGVYRPTMFGAVLNTTTDSSVKLAKPSAGAHKVVYYFPASVLNDVNTSGKTLVVEDGNGLSIVLTKGSLDVSYNNTIMSVKAAINNRQYSDFFVKLTMEFLPTGKIDDYEGVGNTAVISAECVGTNNDIKTWDENILNMYIATIADAAFTADAGAELKKMVENKTTHEEMVKYVSNIVARSRKTLMTDTLSSLTKLNQKAFAFTTFPQNVMTVTKLPTADAVLRGYTLKPANTEWASTDTVDYMGGKAIASKTTGSFAFVGYKNVLPDLGKTVADSTALASIITKYGLDDYLGKGAAFNVNSTATLSTLQGVAARLAGANKDSNPTLWLKNKGFDISGRNSQPATNEQALYLFMAVYSVKTGTKVNSIVIHNYAQTAAIKDVDQKYLQSLRAAFEIGLISDTDIKPKDTVKVNDVLKLIEALNKKVKL